jgi:predicted transposase/invertase (TIGR01784 family)
LSLLFFCSTIAVNLGVPMLSRYLDPKNDLSFKKIFGEEKHKHIPIDFLNAVFHLKGENKIIDLEFLNVHQPAEIAARKESIVDVLVRDQKGVKFIIEMQVAKVQGFEKRAQFYAAKTYCVHFKRGKKYQDLKKVVFLAITNYLVFPKKKRYKSNHVILDNQSYEHDLKDFSFTFVELQKFTKTIDQCSSIEDKWYYFLKHADENDVINATLAKHKEIKEAYEVLDRYSWTEEEIDYYEKLIMSEADMQGTLEAAKKEGIEKGEKTGIEKGKQAGLKEGIEKGEKIGIEKGEKIGIEKGKQAGLKEGRILIAKNLLKELISIQQIAKITNLSEKEICLLKERSSKE